MLGGEVVVDTIAPLLVWEVPYYPTYYFPEGDVNTELLVETGETRRSPSRGEATQYVVKAGSDEGTAYAYHDPKIPELAGHYALCVEDNGPLVRRRRRGLRSRPRSLHETGHPSFESSGASRDRRRHCGRHD